MSSESANQSIVPSASSYKTRFPHLWEFVNQVIIPSELEGIDKVTEVYIDAILSAISQVEEELKDQPGVSVKTDLDSIIRQSSPFPGWMDTGASNVTDGINDQVGEDGELSGYLEGALRNDKIEIKHQYFH